MTIQEDILQNARQYLDLTETDNTEQLQALLGIDPTTTPWCAAFVNAILRNIGINGTGLNNARSFLNWGIDVTDSPQEGDIAVFSRNHSTWQGHVGFISSIPDSNDFHILGGNQGDKVCIENHSLDNLLGVRRVPE